MIASSCSTGCGARATRSRLRCAGVGVSAISGFCRRPIAYQPNPASNSNAGTPTNKSDEVLIADADAEMSTREPSAGRQIASPFVTVPSPLPTETDPGSVAIALE